jgi:hypothetical protein
MNLSEYDPMIAARAVSFLDGRMTVELADGRAVSVPIEWYPRLERATSGQRANWRLIGEGSGIHWPDLDEDVSIIGLIEGRRSVEAERARP